MRHASGESWDFGDKKGDEPFGSVNHPIFSSIQVHTFSMIRRRFHFRETIATIIAEEEHIHAARRGMIKARRDIRHHISLDPFFKATLEPYPVQSESRVVNRMAVAGLSASVGPMAGMAGAIAWSGVEYMMRAGAGMALIDNGGDIVLCSDRVLHVGIHAGASPFSDRLAFKCARPRRKFLVSARHQPLSGRLSRSAAPTLSQSSQEIPLLRMHGQRQYATASRRTMPVSSIMSHGRKLRGFSS